MTVTFKTYMKTYLEVDDRFGDLARDITRDESFPRTTKYDRIMDHLIKSGACVEARETFHDAYWKYLQEREDE